MSEPWLHTPKVRWVSAWLLLLSGDDGASCEAPSSLMPHSALCLVEDARCRRDPPAAPGLWRRAPGDQAPGKARYRPIGLRSRIDEILLSFMPWSFTCR